MYIHLQLCKYHLIKRILFLIRVMERREIYTLGIVGLTASVGLFVVWLRFRNQKGQDSPRGLSIQRASLRTASTRSFNEEEEVLIDEAPTILNALYLYSQDSAKQGIFIKLIR